MNLYVFFTKGFYVSSQRFLREEADQQKVIPVLEREKAHLSDATKINGKACVTKELRRIYKPSRKPIVIARNAYLWARPRSATQMLGKSIKCLKLSLFTTISIPFTKNEMNVIFFTGFGL